MSNDLRREIAETYDADAWEPITGIVWEHGVPWQLWLFARDVDHDRRIWRCHIIQRITFDPEDLDAVTEAEDVFSNAFAL